MPAIIGFPTVAEEAIDTWGEVFANAPERRHFGEYLTGLLVTERKNVSSIYSGIGLYWTVVWALYSTHKETV